MKEAIIFCPGFGAEFKDYYTIKYLIPGIESTEGFKIIEKQNSKILGQTGIKIKLTIPIKEKSIEIYEVYWDDVIDRLSSKKERDKFFSGFQTIFYWLQNSFKVINLSIYIFLQSTILMLLLIFWYIGIILVVFESVSQDPSFLGLFEIPQDFASQLGSFSSSFQAWKIWIIVSAIVALLPISLDTIVDLIDFSRRYSNNYKNEKNKSYRSLVRNRLQATVDDVVQVGDYDRITILSHSFGVLISTDFLGDYQPANQQLHPSFRYITWGGVMETSKSSNSWLAADVNKCIRSEYVKQWNEFYSKQDWLSGPISHQKSPKYISKEIKFNLSFFKKVLGLSHKQYFAEDKLLRHLIFDDD